MPGVGCDDVVPKTTCMKDDRSVDGVTKLLKVRLAEWQLHEKDKEYRPKPIVAIAR